MDAAEELLELASNKFGKLTEAEEKLFRHTANGEMADYSAANEKENDPSEAAKWGPHRVLRSICIAWLCTNKQASQFVTHRGIHIKGTRIDNPLDLMFAKIPFPLYFEKCKFTALINMQYAQIPALNIGGTHTGPISADSLNVEGSINLRCGFKAEGEVRLLGATVGGNLDCVNAQFVNKGGDAFSGDGIIVKGHIYLREGYRAEGVVRLPGAVIGGDLICTNGQFINKGDIAIGADRLKVEGCIYLSDGFRAEGEVRLLGAEVCGVLNCERGQFINRGWRAIIADRLNIGGDVYLSAGFKAEGEVRLPGARIVGDLSCSEGHFINGHGTALLTDGSKVERSILLNRGFKAEGKVSLVGAKIGGNLESVNSRFTNKDKEALSADGLMVGGHVYLRNGFKVQGTVSFIGAIIDKYFCLTDIDSPEEMTLDLTCAKISVLHDRENSWPKQGQLFLHGLEYEEISDESPRDSKTRKKWLRLQKGFWPQPYEQLAKVLRNSGDDTGARDVLIAKNEDKALRTKLTRTQWLWYRLLGPRIGYGHMPWLALRWALGLILVGWALFALGYSCGLITPPGDSAYTTKEELPVPDPGNLRLGISTTYPVFNSLVYSLDVFVPVVEFHQAKYWLPNANRGDRIIKIGPWPLHTGGLLLFWLWTEIVLGWLLSTLFLVGLTGLVRT